MKTKDEALGIPNARLLSAIYFSLLAIILTIAIDTSIYLLGIEQLLPVAQEILLSVMISALFGALFGERIVHSTKPFYMHVFFWAVLMVILALPIYNIGFLFLFKEHHHLVFTHTTLTQLGYLYLLIMVYSFLLIGVWLAIVAGFAAVFLRGYLVYYIMHSLNRAPPS